MYKLVCGVSALVIGLLIFGSYSLVFANSWYVSVTGQLLQQVLNQFPSVHQYLVNLNWIQLDSLISLLQSVTLSIVFAMIFGFILGVFTGLISVVQYAILGALCGFLYFAIPPLMVFVDQQFFSGSLNLPVFSKQNLVDVLMWYLPMMLAIYYTARSRRKKHAQTERFWFRH